MSGSPFFSIIVPVYNKGIYVNRSINSILNQTFKNFEIIIICDPSTDNSIEEVNKFSSYKNVRIYNRNERGPGGYASRNFGIKKSKGDWISFLDADDEYKLDHLEKSYNLIENNKNAKFISSSFLLNIENQDYLDPFTKRNKHKTIVRLSFNEYLKNCIKNCRPNNTNTVVFSKSLLDGTPFFPEGKTNRSGDIYAWVIKIFQAGGIYWSPHIGSITYRDSLNMTSKTELPSIYLNHEMVDEISLSASNSEIKTIKKYANRLIKRAFFEHKKFKKDPGVSLFKLFYWSNDIFFCGIWSLISIIPNRFIFLLRGIKKFVFK